MKKVLLSLLFFAVLADRAAAQKTDIKDPNISNMVNEVSSANLEQVIKKLVSFHTRHTLSDTISKTTGIGAARTWIKS